MTSSGEHHEPASNDSHIEEPASQPGAGGFDLGNLDLGAMMSQIGEMQQSLQDAQETAASQVVEGSAGGGAVRIRVTVGMDFQSVTIDPEVLDKNEVDILEDLVLAALRDSIERANDVQQKLLSQGPGIGDLLGGAGGGIGDLLGGMGGASTPPEGPKAARTEPPEGESGED